MGNIISWLRKEEPARLIPILDRFLVILFRLLYVGSFLILRLFYRVVMGKRRRNKLLLKKKMAFNYDFDIIPVFYYLRFLQFIIKYFRIPNQILLKIIVPPYDYKIYCPVERGNSIDLTIQTIHEDDIIEKFHPIKGGIVVDVGAHIGRYTLIAAKRLGPKGKVIAIEAHPKNFDLLNKNIKLNKLVDNVIPINYAVYSKETKIKLYTPEKESGHNTIMTKRLLQIEKFLEINANTLDHLLQENGISVDEINWIKIDVEGAELEVLKGATGILSKSKDIALLIEIHHISEGVTLYNSILEFLRLYNFKLDFEKIHLGGERHIIMRKKE